MCNCCSIYFCNRKGIIILLPFIVMPLILASLLCIGQYCLMLCSTSSFLCGQPIIIYVFILSSWVSSCVATCVSYIDVHTGTFIDVPMALTFLLIPALSRSLFYVWLFWDSQSVMQKSEPGLYMMFILYWCILSIIHCNH